MMIALVWSLAGVGAAVLGLFGVLVLAHIRRPGPRS